MRGITLGVFSAQPTYDQDFQNVLDVAQTNEITIPPLEVRLRLNKLMVDMKNIGFYQIQDTLANFALGITGFEQFRMIDWKKVGNIYTPVDSPIFTPQGVEGDGVAAYVDTNFNPVTMGVNYTLNDASRGAVVSKENIIPSRTSIDSISFYSGVNNVNTLYNSNGSSNRINHGANNLPEPFDLTGTGYKAIIRESSTEVRMINLGNTQVFSSNSSQLANFNQILLARRSFYSDLGLAIYHMGASIPYPMSQSFRTIYNQFLSDLGLSPIA